MMIRFHSTLPRFLILFIQASGTILLTKKQTSVGPPPLVGVSVPQICKEGITNSSLAVFIQWQYFFFLIIGVDAKREWLTFGVSAKSGVVADAHVFDDHLLWAPSGHIVTMWPLLSPNSHLQNISRVSWGCACYAKNDNFLKKVRWAPR